ncbi:putative secretory lipase [Hypoxylon trugodes]|uniref:putative secretory lipase n=1 Tax=Hypoxylon trugodes TaxID=326681 RepID=UPI0021981CF3|nr:putative secretory lipase [Hypoxylon trugodes]KAI1392305.1 putative secretory lipase [Hypoxylon trugodes]
MPSPLQSFLLFALSLTARAVTAQAPPVTEQSTGFNSTFTLSSSQIESANLSTTLASSINTVVRFDRSQLANGGPAEDTFYNLPPLSNTSALRPGTLLKVQDFTNTSSFVIPPNTALSRILYTTTDYNGTVIPASAFILWPFLPKKFQQSSSGYVHNKTTKAPAVIWAHGTSGFFAPQAPSTHRALWYGDSAPFTLALAGYAVVGPDYAGLGISKSWDGSDIPHQYSLSQTTARDSLYALQASLAAFPNRLDDHFVSFGHSQGGGVAWGVAEVIAAEKDNEFKHLAKGYLGSIAGSPTTDLFNRLVPQFIPSWVGLALSSIFPDFELSAWLTPLGVARTQLFKEISGGVSVSAQLFLSSDNLIRDDYKSTWYVDAYARIANAGRKPFAGPLLVLQGTADPYILYNITSTTIQETRDVYPGGDLEYVVVNGTSHVPTLDATRQIWLRWIEERFEGRPLEKTGYARTDYESWLPLERYQSTGNSFPQFAGLTEYSYEAPLGA